MLPSPSCPAIFQMDRIHMKEPKLNPVHPAYPVYPIDSFLNRCAFPMAQPYHCLESWFSSLVIISRRAGRPSSVTLRARLTAGAISSGLSTLSA